MTNSKEKKYFKVFYSDFQNQARTAIVGFGDNYKDNDSYHENLLDVVSRMVEDGGLWIDLETLIPFHRILMFRPCNLNNGNNQNNGNNGSDINHQNVNHQNNVNNDNNKNNIKNKPENFSKKRKRIRYIHKRENTQQSCQINQNGNQQC